MAEIGPTLREARIRARIDMSEVEARTKIRAKYLRAIENEEWDLLPGPVYIKSFLRTYSDYLGLDSRMLIDEFKRRYERPSDHESARPIASLPRDRQRDRLPRGPVIPPWAAIGLVLVAIVVALYLLGTAGGGTNKASPPASLPAGSHHRAAGPKPRHAPTTPAPPPAPKAANIQLVPTAPVYVCLVNGAGKVLIPGVIYQPGQTIPRFTERKMLLTLGNASVQMKVDGTPVTIAPSSTAIGYLIRASGASKLPASQEPTCTG
jgi:hypothetical protein